MKLPEINLNTYWKVAADLRQLICLLKVVGLFNIIISHQIWGNICQSITHSIKSVIGQCHSSKLQRERKIYKI